MTEYDSLLKVEYFLYNYFDAYSKGETTFGVDRITDLYNDIQGRSLVIALDQATNKTGVCILDFDTKELIVALDLINMGFPSKQLYFESIYTFLSNHIKNANIKHFIYEIPIEHSKNMRTLALLESLRSFIKNFRYRMPSLTDENMVEIYVSAWRGHFLEDDKYNGLRKTRENAKESVRLEVCDMFPALTEFAYRRKEPPDSCDAIGIACGCLSEMYSTVLKGLRVVNKTMPIKNIKYCYEIKRGKAEEILGLLNTEYYAYSKNFEVLEFNTQMSVDENTKRYCGSNKTLGILIVPLTDTKTNQILKWETGQELKQGECYAVFCRRN